MESVLPSDLPAFDSSSAERQARKTEKKLLSLVAQASSDFKLVEPNDRIMVAVSGGKDSFGLLYLLRQLQRRTPFPFSLIAVNLDQKQPGFPQDVLPRYLADNGYNYLIVEEDTYSIVKEKIPETKTYCALCSRLRRGVLYNVAPQVGATKLALGHHRDDAIETLLLNLFYSGQTKAMPAKLYSDDGRNTVIRPLIYCAERDLTHLAENQMFPIIPCNLCGSQENLKRQEVKQLLNELERKNPKLRGNLLAALRNVRLTHMLSSSAEVGQEAEPEEPSSTGKQGSSQLVPLNKLMRRVAPTVDGVR